MSAGIFLRRDERTQIRFGSFNISNGINGGLELDIRGMSQANLDRGIFQETNITDEA